MIGIEAVPVEVDATAVMPKSILVGPPELAVRESVHLIERALAERACNIGYRLPRQRGNFWGEGSRRPTSVHPTRSSALSTFFI